MSSIIKLASNINKLGIKSSDQIELKSTPDLLGIRMGVGEIVAVGGKLDGTTLTDKVIEANQSVLIYPSLKVYPIKYHTIMSVNADLYKHGIVSHINLVEPGRGQDIFVQFRASHKIDLSELKTLVTLYMID